MRTDFRSGFAGRNTYIKISARHMDGYVLPHAGDNVLNAVVPRI
jgi:hypothetical protein